MPHIFPRRFLRGRDILTPKELNDDLHPISDLLAGRLDSTNFRANSLKGHLLPHPDSNAIALLPFEPADSWRPGAAVAEGAYFNVYDDSVECRYQFYPNTYNSTSRPPNFVGLDGITFRDDSITGTNPNSKPFVVPNHGGWVAVKNSNLSANQQLNFSTGKSKLWISAYAQYIWQGFYEYKVPWVPKNRKHRDIGELESLLPDTGENFQTLDEATNRLTIALREREVLNTLGPSAEYEFIRAIDAVNEPATRMTSDASFSFPFNEYGAVEDRNEPGRGGYHHISRGALPCLIQFALRVDGKIIEESITGKFFNFEESSHGLTVTDSTRKIEEDETDEDVTDLQTAIPGFTERLFVFGQRSIAASSSYGDRPDSRPGQKVRSSRSVACGPEVMPVRLGAVVDVQPGDHTVELCVRRLERKKGKYRPGDYVGVFSRRLLAFDLPIETKRQEPSEFSITSFPGSDSDADFFTQPPKIEAFKTESLLTKDNISRPRRILRSQVNDVQSNYLDDNIFPNTHLPSKVRYNETVHIKPGYRVSGYTGSAATMLFSGGTKVYGADAIFPGFNQPDKLNNVTLDPASGWTKVSNHDPSKLETLRNAGWYMLQDADGKKLSVSPPDIELQPHEKLILFMDVELNSIQPIYSDRATELMDMMVRTTIGSGDGGAADIRTAFAHYATYLLAERYLDNFALFAIGYKRGSDWTIASHTVPALVNSYNWVNRTAGYHVSSDPVLPIALRELKDKYIWDVDPFWKSVKGPGIGEFTKQGASFVSDFEAWFTSRSWLTGTGMSPKADKEDPSFGQGGRLAASNLGINIPIMQVISNDTSSSLVFSEFAGFCSSVVLSDYRYGINHLNPRRYTREDGTSFDMKHAWASPVIGRKILKGAKIHFGNSRLSAIKIEK